MAHRSRRIPAHQPPSHHRCNRRHHTRSSNLTTPRHRPRKKRTRLPHEPTHPRTPQIPRREIRRPKISTPLGSHTNPGRRDLLHPGHTNPPITLVDRHSHRRIMVDAHRSRLPHMDGSPTTSPTLIQDDPPPVWAPIQNRRTVRTLRCVHLCIDLVRPSSKRSHPTTHHVESAITLISMIGDPK